MTFSQRIGKVALTKDIQIDSIDTELRNSLWNVLKLQFLNQLTKASGYNNHGDSEYYEFSEILWQNLYKLPVDSISKNDHNTESIIRDKFFEAEWNEVYDLIDFIANIGYQDFIIAPFIKRINEVLETEFSGYRFINSHICPISNTVEVDEIKLALKQNITFTSLNGANIHLTNSLEKLSSRKNPDYRNSIKESISALETTCRILTGENTLGKALNALERKGFNIDDQLKSGFEKIYAFTNNKQSGIRHAIVDEHNEPDFDDAKYILLLCSSMINYLIGKSKTLGISIK